MYSKLNNAYYAIQKGKLTARLQLPIVSALTHTGTNVQLLTHACAVIMHAHTAINIYCTNIPRFSESMKVEKSEKTHQSRNGNHARPFMQLKKSYMAEVNHTCV